MVHFVILLALYALLHFWLLLPAVLSGVLAAVIFGLLWLVWKLKYFILAAIGLEMLIGE